MLYDLYDCSLCVDVAVHMIRRNEMHLVPPASQLCVVSTCVSTGVDPTSFRSNFHSSCSCGANPSVSSSMRFFTNRRMQGLQSNFSLSIWMCCCPLYSENVLNLTSACDIFNKFYFGLIHFEGHFHTQNIIKRQR